MDYDVKMRWRVIANTNEGPIVLAEFFFENDAKQFVRAMNMRTGYHTIEKMS